MRGWRLGAVLAAALVLAACTASPPPVESGAIPDSPFQSLADNELGSLPGVVGVEVEQRQLDSMATPDPE